MKRTGSMTNLESFDMLNEYMNHKGKNDYNTVKISTESYDIRLYARDFIMLE